MITPDPGSLPTDTDALARIAANVEEDLSLRQRAFEALLPTIRRTASRVATRFQGQARQDLLDAAEGDLWGELPTLPDGVRFENWSYGVLRNRQTDRLRVEQSQQRRARAAADRAPVAVEDSVLRSVLEQGAGRTGLLPEEDLAEVRSWPLAPRLALLSLTGLWASVPQEEWRDWVGAFFEAEGLPLPDPFPPDAFGECERLSDRNAIIAEAMGVQRNTLSVWLYRYKPRVRQLRHVRERLEA